MLQRAGNVPNTIQLINLIRSGRLVLHEEIQLLSFAEINKCI